MYILEEINKKGLRPYSILKPPYCKNNIKCTIKGITKINTKIDKINKIDIEKKDKKINAIRNFVYKNISKVLLVNTIEEFDSDYSSEEEEFSDLDYD